MNWFSALALGTVLAGCTAPEALRPAVQTDTIAVVVARFFPVEGDSIDVAQTGDWGRSLAFTRAKVDSVTERVVWALEEGSRFHGYADPDAPAAVRYEILETFEFLEPLPTYEKPGHAQPMTDYRAIFEQIGGAQWVQGRDVKEFWIWGYHGGVVDLWESNMSGPHGDISNSDRDEADLPVLEQTYTMYHYNYQRGAAEAVENHMHQFEAVLNQADGRDDSPPSDWSDLLFWGKFVGSDSTHKLLDPRRAGWSHYPPNAENDYEWANPAIVQSDIEDWNPDDPDQLDSIGCSRWNCDHLDWFVYWMQNMPSAGHDITYQGRKLHNWFHFLSRYDVARKEDWPLWIQN